MTWRIINADAEQGLAGVADGTAQTCVTSPPYWSLRNYGHEGQLGSERTPAEYVENLVRVFRQVRRVLRDDGTLWLNLGDAHTGSGRGGDSGRSTLGGTTTSEGKSRRKSGGRHVDGLPPKSLIGLPWRVAFALQADGWVLRSDCIWSKPNVKPESVKDRPTTSHEYLFLFAKRPMYYYNEAAIREPYAPGSLERYQYKFGGPKNESAGAEFHGRTLMRGYRGQATKDYAAAGAQDPSETKRRILKSMAERGGRNKRTVWSVKTKAYKGAHFATYPEELIEPCILATCRPAGFKRCDCAEIIRTPLGGDGIVDPTLERGGAGLRRPRLPGQGSRPMTRGQQRNYAEQLRHSPYAAEMATAAGESAFSHYIRVDRAGARAVPPELLDEWLRCGWLHEAPPTCSCATEPADVVLDPFTGSGTTGAVAVRHGRGFLGCEINPDYIAQAEARISAAAGPSRREATA